MSLISWMFSWNYSNARQFRFGFILSKHNLECSTVIDLIFWDRNKLTAKVIFIQVINNLYQIDNICCICSTDDILCAFQYENTWNLLVQKTEVEVCGIQQQCLFIIFSCMTDRQSIAASMIKC